MRNLENTHIYILSVIILTLITTGCKKFVDVGAPPTSVNNANVYANDATATAVLTGIYMELSWASLGENQLTAVSSLTGLSSDELDLTNNDQSLMQYYSNSLTSLNGNIWSSVYNVIYKSNAAIEGLNASTSLTAGVKSQLLGEAKFIRAFCYFYLVNLYGDVPLALTTNYKENTTLPRSAKAIVYSQIVIDLKEAQTVLNENFVGANVLTTTIERTRPNKGAATALLARVYLFMGDYVNAERESDHLLKNNQYDIIPLNEVFLKNSREAIWQLQPVGLAENSNTKEGQFFIPLDQILTNTATYLTNDLIEAFESNDGRKHNWININYIEGKPYFYAYKYKIGFVNDLEIEYSMVLRLGEQVLIRAEARAQQNKIAEAESDLNILRQRASLPPISLSSQMQALKAVAHERRVELFTEWGHRWLDLKRTDKANEVLSVLKGANWQSTDQLFPLPQGDIDKNPNLRSHQNPGY